MELNNKLIIRNYTNLSDLETLEYITTVIKEGKVSTSRFGDQYCFATSFNSGIVVESTRNKDTYTFYIFKKGEI
jgi:hypothetical protein